MIQVTLKKVSLGTDLSVVWESLPDVLGWQESLARLAKLVEAEIPD